MQLSANRMGVHGRIYLMSSFQNSKGDLKQNSTIMEREFSFSEEKGRGKGNQGRLELGGEEESGLQPGCKVNFKTNSNMNLFTHHLL